jgi:multidrug resistance efflux pump
VPAQSSLEQGPEILDVIGEFPPGILHWGTTLVALIAAGALLLSWLIRYPDVIAARAEITTARPPLRVVARSSGRLVRLSVLRDGQPVREGEILAVIENPANSDAVLALAEQLRGWTLREGPAAEVCAFHSSDLGELEVAYAEFVRRCRERVLRGERLARHDRLGQLRRQIATSERLGEKLERQAAALEAQQTLALDRVHNTRELLARGYASTSELSAAQERQLEQQAELEKARADRIANAERIEELRRAVIDAEYERAEQADSIGLGLEQAEKELRGALAQWERRYVLRAAVSGEAWLRYWSPNQSVKEGEDVMLVVPESRDVLARLLLPERNSGKVALGQRVHIEMDSYRTSEVGVVRGVVDSIAPVARDGFHVVNVRLPDGLRTSYGQELRYRPEMAGSAEIVTEDLRLLQRAFYQFRHLTLSSAGAR